MDLVIVSEENAVIQEGLGQLYGGQALSPLAKVVLKKVVLKETRIPKLVSHKMFDWAWFSRFYETDQHIVIIWLLEAQQVIQT